MFFFCFSLYRFVLVFFALAVLGLVSSVLSQQIGWEEHLQNDLFCVEWDENLNSVTNRWKSLIACISLCSCVHLVIQIFTARRNAALY